jgi:tetratricopeptide (TPR) repeat protein
MHLKTTLILIFNCLIINDSLAKDAALESCDAALRNRQYAQAIQMAEKHANQAEFWLCKGRAQSGLAQNAAAQQSFKQAISLKPEGLDLISAHMLLGNAQLEAKVHEAAIDSYQQALRLSEQQNMRRYTRIAHNLIGEAYFDLGQYAQALNAFENGEKLAMNDDERADSHIHEAMAYQQLQQADKAIEYQLKGVMMLRKSGTPDQYAEASLTLGKLFAAKKDYASADKTYQRLMEYAHDNGGDFYEAKTAIYWAESKRAQGDTAGAQQLIQQAEAMAARLKDAELDALLVQAK